MHQGTLKSAVRRSLTKSILLPSEDGNEAVHSRSSGKPRSTGVMEFTTGRTRRGQDPSPSRGKEEEKVMAYRNSNDFQLLQVSREAHKLADMIDSWSKEADIGSRSQFFAEDLLRGALDLQESLDMLKKLQDASKKMPRVNNRQKTEIVGKKDENVFTQQLGYKGFAGGSYQNRLHEPRFPSDNFSRNYCVEELKQVIKESLHKQNIRSSSSDDGKSSSSRSMIYGTSNILEDKCIEHNTLPANPICSTSQPSNGKSSNLIAKLMGLDEVPSRIIQPVRRDERNCVNLPRPRFDIEMPKTRKTESLVQNNEQKQYRLDELVEAMHYKGLLKQSQVEEKGLVPPFCSTTELEQYGRNLHNADQLPPIVIMKPLHLRYQESNHQKELPLDEALMQERIQEIKLVQENNNFDNHKHNMVAKLREQKELKHIRKDITELLPNYGTPSSSHHRQERKKTIMAHKLNAEEQKSSRLHVKKQEEKGVKLTRMTISNPKTSTVQAKPNKEQHIARTNASILQNQASKSTFRPMSKASADNSKDKSKVGGKPVRKPAIIESVTDGRRYNENGTATKSCNRMSDVPNATGTFDGYNLLEQGKQEKKPWNPDIMSKDNELFCEVIPRYNQDNKDYKSVEVIPLPNNKKIDGIGVELKDLFLSSQSFLSCAKKFFRIDTTHIYNQTKSTDMVRKSDSKLLLDISEELMVRKYHRHKRTIHPLMNGQSCGRITYFSIDKLVEEISDGIQKLMNYSKLDNFDSSEGSLYLRLERELMCKDTAINSVWDIGWDHWICLEEADLVVEEVGKYILSWLIEEAALELI
ncbi:hypothetical protein Cni_G10900 [Canna indica]|uniref:DUF4378 domain-containing protein n=1 Tax=Canna indica TaxID=4628 RepID=A0AAQ3Q7Q0_9LILI|nr:hypothetical protein Cni_G10900 [Canna indica]